MPGIAGARLSPTAFLSKYDPRKFGATPHRSSDSGAEMTARAEVNATAFQTAFDLAYADVLANNNSRLDTVLGVPLPADPAGYRIARPIYNPGGVSLYGLTPGGGAAELGVIGAYPAILMMKKLIDDSTHFVDANGILDSSAAATTGVRYVPSLNSDSYISLRASAADLGGTATSGDTKRPDYNRNMAGFTLEFCFKRTGGSWPSGEYLGAKDFDNNPAPFSLVYTPGSNRYDFLWMDNSGDYNTISWPCAASGTVHRCILCMAFATPAAQAYAGVDAAAVAVTTTVNTGPSWLAGVRMGEPSSGGLTIASNYGESLGTTGKGLIIAGLKLSKVNQYQMGATNGDAPVRVDSATYNDLNSFVTFRTNDYFMLGPHTTQTGWDGLVKWTGNNGYGYGYFIPANLFAAGNNYTDPCALKDIRFQQYSNIGHGSLVMEVLTYGLRIWNCDFANSARAIDQDPYNISYTTDIANCNFYGQYDTSVMLLSHILQMKNVFFGSSCRTALRLTQTTFDIRQFFGANTDMDSFAELNKIGANCVIDYGGTDVESFHPDLGVIISKGASTGGISHLTLRDFAMGGVSDGNYPIRVRSQSNGLSQEPAVLRLENSMNRYINPAWPAIVGTDGTEWVVEIAGVHGTVGGSGQVPYAQDIYHDARVPLVVSDGSTSYPTPVTVADPAFDFTDSDGFIGRWRASDLDASLDDDDPVTSWAGVAGTDAAFTPLASAGAGTVTFKADDGDGRPYVLFDGAGYMEAPSGASGAGTDFCVMGVAAGNPSVGLFALNPSGASLHAQSGVTMVSVTRMSRQFSLPNSGTVPYWFAFRGTSGTVEMWIGLRQRGWRAYYVGTATLGRFTLGKGGPFFSMVRLYDFAVHNDSPTTEHLKLMGQQMCHDCGLAG